MKKQIFTGDQIELIRKGNLSRKKLRTHLDEALNVNKFGDNYILSSLPGLGKTWEMENMLKKMKNPPLVFRGSNGMFGYTIDIATAIYLNGGPDRKLKVIMDDCDVIFEDKNIDTTKKMFDDTRILRYGKNYRSLKGLCSDMQWDAICSFADDSRAGLDIDVRNVTFVTLTNMHLNTVDEVNAQELGTPRYERFNARYAIRRRTEYKHIDMSPNDLWGYVADVVLNEKICEKFFPLITRDYKEQILLWCWSKWETGITERNLSIIEKMTKKIVQYPEDYLDVWEQEYVIR